MIKYWIPFLFCIQIVFCQKGVTSPIWWESEIQAAIQERDSALKSWVKLDSKQALYPIPDAPLQAFLKNPPPPSFWNSLFLAIAYEQILHQKDLNLWGNSISLAEQKSAGHLWVVTHILIKYKLDTLAQQALTKLHLKMVQSGATQAPILCQQLLVLAKQSPAQSRFLTEWAHRFDPSLSQIDFQQLFNPSESQFLTQSLLTRWDFQADLAYRLYTLFRNACLIIISAMILVLIFKNQTYWSYPFSKILQKWSNKTQNRILGLVPLLSLACGIVPFLWIWIVVLWRMSTGVSRSWLWIAMAIALLSPFDSMIRHTLSAHRLPHHPLNNYLLSQQMGASPELIQGFIQSEKQSPHELILAALFHQATLSQDLGLAEEALFKLEKLNPHFSQIPWLKIHLAWNQGDKALALRILNNLEVSSREVAVKKLYSSLLQGQFTSNDSLQESVQNQLPWDIISWNLSHQFHLSQQIPLSEQLPPLQISPLEYWQHWLWSSIPRWGETERESRWIMAGLPLLFALCFNAFMFGLFVVLIWKFEWNQSPDWIKNLIRQERKMNHNQQVYLESVKKFQQRRFRYHFCQTILPGLGMVLEPHSTALRQWIWIILSGLFLSIILAWMGWNWPYPWWQNQYMNILVLTPPLLWYGFHSIRRYFEWNKERDLKNGSAR